VKHAEEQVGTRLEDAVIQVGKRVDEFMFSRIRGMKDLAEDPDLKSEVGDVIDKKLSRYIHFSPYFREVMIVDTHGLRRRRPDSANRTAFAAAFLFHNGSIRLSGRQAKDHLRTPHFSCFHRSGGCHSFQFPPLMRRQSQPSC
jgi:hypothetical protein